MSKEQINALLSAGDHFVHCFQIHLKTGRRINLTSSDHKILGYFPNSGLSVESWETNDSAHNNMRIKGIFEKNGIEKGLDLDGATIKILFYFTVKNIFLEWIELHFSEIQYDGMSFVLVFRSEIFKLHRSILCNFSANCRANFGDNKCKVEAVAYSAIYDVVSIDGENLKIAGCTRPDNFFDGGRAVFDDGSSYEIKLHIKSNFTLLKSCDKAAPQRIVLTPGCDKNFVTCCNRYNNAINFRGEPDVK